MACGSLRTRAACLSGPRAPHGRAPPARADSVPAAAPHALWVAGDPQTGERAALLASGRCTSRRAGLSADRRSPLAGLPRSRRPTCQARSRRRGVCGVAIPACLSAESPPQSPALLLSLKLIRGIRGASVGHRGPHSAHIHDRRCWCCRKSSCSRSLFLLRSVLPVRKHFVFFFFFFFFK